MKRFTFIYCLLILLIGILSRGNAQTGGNYIYNFLSYSNTSRIAALGGGSLAVYDNDPTILLHNPSLIGERHHTALSINVVNYFANTTYGSALYAHTFKKIGSFAFNLQFINYGKFTRTDEAGIENGTFSCGDYAATIAWGRQLDSNFTIGADLKLIYSAYDAYKSFGLAVDVAASYINKHKKIALSLLLKNIGTPLVNYVPGQFEKIPFDIQIAFSQQFKFMPVRYHIILHHLYRWDMAYVGENDPLLNYDVSTKKPIYPTKAAQFFDNFFRHITVGIEILPCKYLSLQLAYNHHRHQEMKIPQKKTLSGFSYGFSINIHSIQFGFSREHYARGVAPNFFNFAVNISELSQYSQERKIKKIERQKL